MIGSDRVRLTHNMCYWRLEGIEIQQTPRVADIFAQISCYVCQGPSSGIHFGKIFIESKISPQQFLYIHIQERSLARDVR